MAVLPVIYVEDDQNDAYFMQSAFKKAGIDRPLVILTNGQQVIDYLEGSGQYAERDKHPLPGLLLLDLKLPFKSGFEVMRWIREQRLTGLKVIVVSSSGQALDIELAKELGALDYIIKPSSPSKLIEIVQRIKNQWLS